LTTAPLKGGAVQLAWTNNVSSAEGFEILRGFTDSSLSLIGAVDADRFSFRDSNVSAGIQYYYKIVPFTTVGGSIQSRVSTNVANVTTLADGYSWKESLQVPLNPGQSVTSLTHLDSSKTYLVVISGAQSFGNGYTADAQYWYDNANTNNN